MAMMEIEDDVHKMVLRKQIELFDITGKKTNLSKLASTAIKKGIDYIGP